MYSGPASIRMFTTAENTAMLEKARRHSFNAADTSGCVVRPCTDWERVTIILLARLDDEIGFVKWSDIRQGDRIGVREMDHGIPIARHTHIADRGLQRVPIGKAVSLHVDDIVLRRLDANLMIALVEIGDGVVA